MLRGLPAGTGSSREAAAAPGARLRAGGRPGQEGTGGDRGPGSGSALLGGGGRAAAGKPRAAVASFGGGTAPCLPRAGAPRLRPGEAPPRVSPLPPEPEKRGWKAAEGQGGSGTCRRQGKSPRGRREESPSCFPPPRPAPAQTLETELNAAESSG